MTRLRLAVVGAGHLGRIHARLAAANPQFELVAVVDPIPAASGAVAAELGVEAFSDHRLLKDRVDAAIVATTTQTHHAIARDLISHGIHVLVEKPLTIRPFLVSKLNTLAQILLAGLVLAANGFGFDAGIALTVALVAVGVLTGLSAAAYLAAWTRHMAS